VLEIGFGHKIPKLNFVAHSKIYQENLRKKSYYQIYHNKVEKSGKTLISCLMGKIPYFGVFPTFWWYNLSNNFILKFSKQIFQWKTIFSLGILWPNPISSTLF
jgi:hypothetical protein